MTDNDYLARQALQTELRKLFNAARFDSFVNDLSNSLYNDVIGLVKKTNPQYQDYVGAARNVLREKLSIYIKNG